PQFRQQWCCRSVDPYPQPSVMQPAPKLHRLPADMNWPDQSFGSSSSLVVEAAVKAIAGLVLFWPQPSDNPPRGKPLRHPASGPVCNPEIVFYPTRPSVPAPPDRTGLL